MKNIAGNDIDPLRWARRPRSAIAFHHVKDLADSGDDRFKAILDKLVADGVATAEGQLVKRWDGAQWVRA